MGKKDKKELSLEGDVQAVISMLPKLEKPKTSGRAGGLKYFSGSKPPGPAGNLPLY